jgi:hypothetical protein
MPSYSSPCTPAETSSVGPGRAPAIAGAAGGAVVPMGPVVRVTRGKTTETVPVGK